MPKEERKKGTHLTWDDRHEIQKGLKEHRTFKEIAYIIGCSPDTVSKEIRRHRYHKLRNRDGILHASPNRCKYRNSCRRWDVCKKKKGHKCRIPCRECISCNKLCPDFVDAPCPIEHKAPYVCNNCPKSISCLFDKYLYNADYAHKEYCETLRKSRQGIDMTRDELAALDSLVSPLIRKGQPLAHILAHHAEEIPCGERTLYKYISAGYLTARNLDMRRTVRYRKRVRSVPTPKSAIVKKKDIIIQTILILLRKRRHTSGTDGHSGRKYTTRPKLHGSTPMKKALKSFDKMQWKSLDWRSSHPMKSV